MTTVSQLLSDKGHQVFSVSPDASVYDAIANMAMHGIGALAVMHEGKLVGIVSERDYARKVILRDRGSRTTLVREIMTPDVVTIDPEKTVEHAMKLMTAHRIRHLPVLDQGQVAGMLSIGDLVKAVIGQQRFEIEQLQEYIAKG
ncbi:MAG: CBS domain-containing protein [Alphaproteobacteria bacterium]|nr:CBS domain-containing protein [Alphaproteobacteria bacterium]